MLQGVDKAEEDARTITARGWTGFSSLAPAGTTPTPRPIQLSSVPVAQLCRKVIQGQDVSQGGWLPQLRPSVDPGSVPQGLHVPCRARPRVLG